MTQAALSSEALSVRNRRRTFEATLQLCVVEWLTRLGKPNLIWFHPANERRRSPRQRAYPKRMGVKAGVPDICIARPGATAAFLELKSRDGRQTAEQAAFEQLCKANGSPYAVARTIDEAIAALTAWDCIRSHHPTATAINRLEVR